MSWFSKKEEKEARLPEVPNLPELPPIPATHKIDGTLPPIQNQGLPKIPPQNPTQPKNELPPLPSFPSSPAGDKISNAAVKQAIKEPPIEKNNPLPELPKEPKTKEIEGSKPPEEMVASTPPQVPVHHQEMPAHSPMPIETQTKEMEPIFVRIDNYQDSITNLQDVKKHVLEIESELREIKEIRKNEELELQSWETKIQNAKAKLDSIDKTIFQKVSQE